MPMYTCQEIRAKSLLRRRKRVDSWFISCYGMNLYRGCAHDCAYCDGRAEKYQVTGDFGQEMAVKVNAIPLLAQELDPARRRVPLRPCYMVLGGGVGDCYQPAEREYRIAQQVLGLLEQRQWPVHVLTKSTLVERDLPLLHNIHAQRCAIVSMSFSSVDPDLCSIFEPGVPPPADRLSVLRRFREQGIPCGMFLMPVLPLLSDTEEQLEASVAAAADAGLDFIVFGGMTLKQGRQAEHFFAVLGQYFPELIPEYEQIYTWDKWGGAKTSYYTEVSERFFRLAKKYAIPVRIPRCLFADILEEDDLVCVLLDQLDYLLQAEGKQSSLGRAAWYLSQQKQPLREMGSELARIKHMGPKTLSLVQEILTTGTCRPYEERIQWGRSS